MLEGSALGALVELMVEAEILAGSDGRLLPSRVEPDVDHRDIVVANVGGFGALWLQVKGTTPPDSEGRIVAFANYRVDAILESARLLYPRRLGRRRAASSGEDLACPLPRFQTPCLPRALRASRPGQPPVLLLGQRRPALGPVRGAEARAWRPARTAGRRARPREDRGAERAARPANYLTELFSLGLGSGVRFASTCFRRYSNAGGSEMRSPRCSFGSSVAKPGPTVAISNSTPLGSRKYMERK